LAYKNCKICIFETNTQLIFFKKYTRSKCENFFFFYSLCLKEKNLFNSLDNSKIIIGIPGSYDTERRDYNFLMNTCEKLNVKESLKLKLIFIGNFKNIDSKFTSFFKKKKIEIVFFREYISMKKYVELLNSVDYLLSIHKKQRHPFTFAGSGIINDSLTCNKTIILRNIFDPFREFCSAAIYYDDLLQILQCLIRRDILNKYSNSKNKKNKLLNKQIDYSNIIKNTD
jgi:hypothetical protein